mgnify:CR=1 FL=1|tara:strand:+ start:1667 stop:2605 length:939 start_codon:yes stop_codon:yes gene_type:complete
MANKKISQLVGMGANEAVSGSFLLPVGAGATTGPYTTKKITTKELADFIFTGDNSTYIGFPADSLSGVNKDIYFNNNDANWSTASNVVTQNPYLQVRASDGLLVTGSGIGAAVGGDNMGNCTATTTVNMQNNNISNVGSAINFQAGGNIGSSAGGISINSPSNTKVSLTAPEVEINSSTLIDINGTTSLGGNVTVEPTFDLTVEDIIIQKTSRHNVHTATTALNWSNSNVQKVTTSSSDTYQFSNALHGQTLTMYVKNGHTSAITPSFTSGTYVKWGGTGGPPHIDTARTNVYTFICYNEAIFASAITGYVL